MSDKTQPKVSTGNAFSFSNGALTRVVGTSTLQTNVKIATDAAARPRVGTNEILSEGPSAVVAGVKAGTESATTHFPSLPGAVGKIAPDAAYVGANVGQVGNQANDALAASANAALQRNNVQWLDANGDGVLDKSDPAFAAIKLRVDVQCNGLVELGEMQSLSDLGITSINLKTGQVNYSAADTQGHTVEGQTFTAVTTDSAGNTTGGGWGKERKQTAEHQANPQARNNSETLTPSASAIFSILSKDTLRTCRSTWAMKVRCKSHSKAKASWDQLRSCRSRTMFTANTSRAQRRMRAGEVLSLSVLRGIGTEC